MVLIQLRMHRNCQLAGTPVDRSFRSTSRILPTSTCWISSNSCGWTSPATVRAKTFVDDSSRGAFFKSAFVSSSVLFIEFMVRGLGLYLEYHKGDSYQ